MKIYQNTPRSYLKEYSYYFLGYEFQYLIHRDLSLKIADRSMKVGDLFYFYWSGQNLRSVETAESTKNSILSHFKISSPPSSYLKLIDLDFPHPGGLIAMETLSRLRHNFIELSNTIYQIFKTGSPQFREINSKTLLTHSSEKLRNIIKICV